MSLANLQSYKDIESSMSIVKDSKGQQRLMTEFRYKDPVQVTFSPANSNYAVAKGSAQAIARKLMKKGKLITAGLK